MGDVIGDRRFVLGHGRVAVAVHLDVRVAVIRIATWIAGRALRLCWGALLVAFLLGGEYCADATRYATRVVRDVSHPARRRAPGCAGCRRAGNGSLRCN